MDDKRLHNSASVAIPTDLFKVGDIQGVPVCVLPTIKIFGGLYTQYNGFSVMDFRVVSESGKPLTILDLRKMNLHRDQTEVILAYCVDRVEMILEQFFPEHKRYAALKAGTNSCDSNNEVHISFTVSGMKGV